ncbi:AAA family ATPase [Bacillus sp. BPN334]|uniref:AAA family ATPase n=1 Tax=Bacillus sp. BPN334 TaxID=2217815 RepID=UPI0011ED7D2F|nr:AAA family ATPase [Bacillus sp. BPN334]KAA0794959.1 recombinase RecF [Bacillus sp. BPN334]
MLVINDLKISGIGGINHLEIKFNKGLNLICGPNGVGKTTILESIAEVFSDGTSKILKRNANFQEGKCEINYSTKDQENISSTYTLLNFEPLQSVGWHSETGDLANNLIYFKTERSFSYQSLDAISKDPQRESYQVKQNTPQGTQFSDFKNWFINRYVFSHINDQPNASQKKNMELAIECFGILDENIQFKTVQGDTFDILLETPNGQIYYEYLSSGFKSCLFIIQGLIKEIEFRFKKEKSISVRDFEGLVLIDELDLHLHPHWQSKLIHLLKKVLPKAQIIATTHSPHMIQNAEITELIPLGIDQNGQVIVRKLPSSQYGFQGWTVEEILIDVMGLESTHSPIYTKSLRAFEQAIENENTHEILSIYKKLDLMLHPGNPLRKVLNLQVAQSGGKIN